MTGGTAEEQPEVVRGRWNSRRLPRASGVCGRIARGKDRRREELGDGVDEDALGLFVEDQMVELGGVDRFGERPFRCANGELGVMLDARNCFRVVANTPPSEQCDGRVVEEADIPRIQVAID